MSTKVNTYLKQGFHGLCFLLLLTATQNCKNPSSSKQDDVKDTELVSTAGITYVRKNASTPGAQADLEAFNKAMQQMKGMICDSTIGWYYQGAIHWVPDVVKNGNPYCPSYTQKPQLKTAWQNCTHHHGSGMHFLIWHRLFIWYFEKIIRKISGKKDFALPYWEYVNAQYRVMPGIFRDPKDSLYTGERISILNQGQPIDIKYAQQYLVEAMNTNNEDTDYETFNSGIDAAPHGAMHDYIGAGADGYPGYSPTMWNSIYQSNAGGQMANVPSAAFDPIFWVHHANIDYLWTVWDTSANGARPILKELEEYQQPYVFFDENGKKVTYTVAEALAKAFDLDYSYDTVPPVKRVKQLGVAKQKEEVLSLEMNQQVSVPQQLVNIKVDSKAKLFAQNKDLSRKSYMLEVTVGYKTPPKYTYTVYIDTDKPDPNKIAGFMNFFGAKEMLEMMPDMEVTKVFLYNITQEYDIKTMKDNLKLLITNSAGKPASEITIKKVRIETRDL